MPNSKDSTIDPFELSRAKGVSESVVKLIAEQIPSERIASKLKEMLEAKLSNGQPDWRAVEIAIRLHLSYTEGLPVQRQEIITHKVSSAPTASQLLSNPVAVAAIARTLAADPQGRKALMDALKDQPAIDLK